MRSFCFPMIAGFGLATVLLGCSTRVLRTEPPPVIDRSYIDLQAGWRIRTVSPILKAGTSRLEIKETKLADGRTAYSAGDDLLGYETSFYSVTRRKDSGIAVTLEFSEITMDSKNSRQPHPRLSLFELPAWARYVRLVFLTRVSSADHNQAVLATSNLASLERLSQQVEADPGSGCQSQAEIYCVWVPQGSAVRLEKRDPANARTWVPVF